MTQRIQWQAVRVVVGSLAVIAAGCGQSEHSPVGPTAGFSAGTIGIAPAGAIVGTSVLLESQLASDPSGSPLSYNWDFGDGETAPGSAAITHVYATEGIYVATVTVNSVESGSTVASLNVPVRSVTARWSGDLGGVRGEPAPGPHGRVSITQEGLDLRGTYQDDSRQGIVEGRISDRGTVSFTVTSPGFAPVTFTGTAGPDVVTLVGAVHGPDVVGGPCTIARN